MAAHARDLVTGGLRTLPVPAFPDSFTLDYTLDSLHRLDDYLVKFREPLQKDASGHVILDSPAIPLASSDVLWPFVWMIGGYTGEVMRRASKPELNWISFADLAQRGARLKALVGDEASIATAYGLINRHGAVSFPLYIVLKVIVNALEDSLHVFAKHNTRRSARGSGGAAERDENAGIRDFGALLRAGRIEPALVRADRDILRRYNNTYGSLPRYYIDREFVCRDCGARDFWTADAQRWWYEVIHESIQSEAVRCSACRQVRLAQSAAHPGSNLLGEQVNRLRALAAMPPAADALSEVEAALQSKWWGLRVVAIETLGRWGGADQIAQLEAFVAARDGPSLHWSKQDCWESRAADAARKALWLIAQEHREEDGSDNGGSSDH